MEHSILQDLQMDRISEWGFTLQFKSQYCSLITMWVKILQRKAQTLSNVSFKIASGLKSALVATLLSSDPLSFPSAPPPPAHFNGHLQVTCSWQKWP